MPRIHFLKRYAICYGILFFIVTLSSVIQSCCWKKHGIACLTIEKIFLVPYDDSGEKPEKYTKEIYGKALTLELWIEKESRDECAKKNPSFSLFPQAYALTCPVDVIGDEVLVFNVYADRKFDEAHEAGSRLNDLFEMNNFESIYSRHASNSIASMLLLHNPADTGTFVFTVHLELASGKVLDASTPPVKLLK